MSRSDGCINLVFLMAGRGARFGYKFKPFLRIGDEAFIEAAFRPFRRWLSVVRQTVFAYTEEQESQFAVEAHLAGMFPDVEFRTARLAKQTRGPAETLALAVACCGLSGPAIICDCDHSVDVSPLFEAIERESFADCRLPIWEISADELNAWSVVAMSDGVVKGIAEKQLPAVQGKMAGVIGCYYFADSASVAAACRLNEYTNLSEVVAQFIAEGKRVTAVPILTATFFGDPERLRRAVAKDDSSG